MVGYRRDILARLDEAVYAEGDKEFLRHAREEIGELRKDNGTVRSLKTQLADTEDQLEQSRNSLFWLRDENERLESEVQSLKDDLEERK